LNLPRSAANTHTSPLPKVQVTSDVNQFQILQIAPWLFLHLHDKPPVSAIQRPKPDAEDEDIQ
jgi:hypothetical protein